MKKKKNRPQQAKHPKRRHDDGVLPGLMRWIMHRARRLKGDVSGDESCQGFSPDLILQREF